MNHGQVHQLAAPEATFHAPANLFVADSGYIPESLDHRWSDRERVAARQRGRGDGEIPGSDAGDDGRGRQMGQVVLHLLGERDRRADAA